MGILNRIKVHVKSNFCISSALFADEKVQEKRLFVRHYFSYTYKRQKYKAYILKYMPCILK